MAIQTAQDEFLQRLEAGEDNPYLVYELCKAWEPESFRGLLDRLPLEVDWDVAQDGWSEYKRTRR